MPASRALDFVHIVAHEAETSRPESHPPLDQATGKSENLLACLQRIWQPCLKCGGALAEQTAWRGRNAGGIFLGCSAFPQCRYTRPR